MTAGATRPATDRAASRFDILVIGAGPGGYVAAIRAAQLGLRTAIVEREALGGICLNWGCIPTKALLRAAEILTLAREAGEYGVRLQGVEFDFAAMVARSRKVAGQLNAGVRHLLRKHRVEVHMGRARLLAPDTVEIRAEGEAPRQLRAEHVILATGARARELDGLEADGRLVWNYRHALAPDVLPARLLVVGSGAIGVEFAHFFRTLGSEVCVVEWLDRILPAEDAEISALAAEAFRRQGMEMLTGARVTALTRQENSVTAEITQAGQRQRREFDRVISAVGITGNVEDLGLETVGVAVERGHVRVDRECRTSVDGIRAIGDVAGPPWLAHKASHEGVAVAEAIAGGSPHWPEAAAIPGCTYCHPQIASVGLSEAAARESGREVRVGRFPLRANGKAIALGDADGLVKTVFDAATGALLGAHLVGPEVTEMVQGFAVAMTLESTEAELMQTVFPHPTVSEAMHESVLDAHDRAIHF